MKYFEQAQENLKRSNFFKALELFQISLREDALSDELKVFCCEKIEKINQILNRETTTELLEFLAKHYFDLGKYQRSQDFFGKLFKETKEISYLKRQFESLRCAGDVAGSLDKSQDILELLYKRRLSDEIIKFLDNNKNLFKSSEISSWKIRAYILAGDVLGLEQEVQSWGEYKRDETRALTQELLELTGHDAKYWHNSDTLIKTMWKALCTEEYHFLLTRKRVIKLILDFWLITEKDQDLLRQTIIVAQKYQLPVIGHDIAKYVGDFELGEYFLGQMPRGAFSTENYDFGEDLFGNSEEDQEKKLVRDINFLMKSGKKAEVLKLTYQLEKVNPTHPLVIEILKSSKTTGPLSIDENKIDSLLKELDRYSPTREGEEDVAKSFLGIVKHYDNEFIQQNFEDMIIGFNLVNLPEVALEIIKRVDLSQLNERDQVNLKYLEIESNLDCGNAFKARDLAEDMLATIPMVEDERTAIAYLRAEAYYQLGNLEYAKRLFRAVAQKKPNYRLTEQRILRLEENQ